MLLSSEESPRDPRRSELTATSVLADKGGPHYGCMEKRPAGRGFRRLSEEEQWLPESVNTHAPLSETSAHGRTPFIGEHTLTSPLFKNVTRKQ